jgi:ribosomal protein L11 methyltransferase
MGATQERGWTEVRVVVPYGWEELVGEVLSHPPATGAVLGRISPTEEDPPRGFELVRSYLPASEDTPGFRGELARRVAALSEGGNAPELRGVVLRFRRVPEKDWVEHWRRHWKPFRVGRLAIVTPDWQGKLRPGDVGLRLEPGRAFGTGRHATTRACLRAIQERIRPGQRILDAGTGSGILAVASALLGAGSVLAFDVDPNVRPIFEQLARQNGVESRCSFRAGGFEALGDEDTGFDGILANIYHDVLRDEAAELAGRLAPGGWYAFSGCRISRRAPVGAAIRSAGLRIEEERTTVRWVTFVGTK